MAKTETRFFTIHKSDAIGRFTQVNFEHLGKALGVLTKVGAKNLYLYLISNQNNYDFELKVANFANWLGDPIYDDEGVKTNKSATYRKQINDGIEQLIECGYLVQKYPGVSNIYDFHEVPQITQEVPQVTVSEKAVAADTNAEDSPPPAAFIF